MAPLGHILNFYEDFDLSLGLLRESLREILEGRLAGVEEKIDGQNLTFTVRNDVVETFYKGAAWSRVRLGGRKIEEYAAQYADRPRVGAALIAAHQALADLVASQPELSRRLFREGRVVMNCEMVARDNLNTVPYESDTICLVGAHAMDPELAGGIDAEALESFLTAAEGMETRFRLRRVPRLTLSPVDGEVRDRILWRFDSLVSGAGLSAESNVGDLLTALVLREIVSSGRLDDWRLDRGTLARIARRIALDDTAAFSYSEARRHVGGLWDTIVAIAVGSLPQRSVLPLERIFHETAYETFRRVGFVVAPNDPAAGEGLRDWIGEVSLALESGRVVGSVAEIERARVTLEKIDTSLFGKPVEGIVFPWRGEVRKLTGCFTPINKLRGMFYYGKSPLKILPSKVSP